MKRVALLAAAALAWAGCDYWSNLVDGKSVDRKSFILAARDAWTGQAVGESECRDVLTGESWKTNPAGERGFTDAPLGPYRFACEHPSYFPRTADFNFGILSDPRLVVSMARKPGADWYPGEPEKQVGLVLAQSQAGLVGRGIFRVPGTLLVNAAPWDTNSSFHYAWSFSRNTLAASGSEEPMLALYIGSIPADTIVDSLNLDVTARFQGVEPYALGDSSMAITFVRNKKPSLKVVSQRFYIPRGCPNDETFQTLIYLAHDSDGTCDSITFSTGDRDSPIENLPRGSKFCPDNPEFPDSAIFYLKAYRPEPGIPIRKRHSLTLKAWDDNKEFREETIFFDSRGNVRPRAEFTPVGGRYLNYVSETMKLEVFLYDEDSQIISASLDWGDGTTTLLKDIVVNLDSSFQLHDFISHVYERVSPPEGFKIRIATMDICSPLVLHWDTLQTPIHVINNSKPRLTVVNRGFFPPGSLTYRLRVTVSDPDMGTGLDFLKKIEIQWGDASAPFRELNRFSGLDTLFEYTYSQRPGPQSTINITVSDNHNGLADTTLPILP
jgi:hypothetical protein